MLSTQVFEAASISITSTKLSSFIHVHILHLLQGFQSFLSKQFAAFASILAVEVLPVHLGPQRR
jgi:hypothetical protein